MTDLDAVQRASLLQLARASIRAELTGCPSPDLDPSLTRLPARGAFVTLRTAGRLRGCIGTFVPRGSLAETVREMAVAAAHDPRFVDQPVSAAELSDLKIEISILSPLERVGGPDAVEVGRHGVYVRRGLSTGCFLPDVAVEHGWDSETFLSQCCRQKAGLAADAWRERNTELSVFTVEKLGEPG